MKPIVAVTGASGHVGSNLVRSLLAEGRRVRVLEHQDSMGFFGLGVDVVRGDVLNEHSLHNLVDGVECVYHLAAKIHLGYESDQETEEINVLGTRNLANVCLRQGVKRLIHFSSIHALAPNPDHEILDEQRPLVCNPAPCYDLSKADGEREIQSAVQKGLDAVIVSPCGIIGPYDFKPSHMGQLILALATQKFNFLCEGGFHWVDVRDVVAGALAAEKKGKTGERYLLTSEWLSLTDIAEIVAECSQESYSLVLPSWIAYPLAYTVETYSKMTETSPAFTRVAVNTLQHYRFVTSDKARKTLGFHPRPIRETIADTLAWHSTHFT